MKVRLPVSGGHRFTIHYRPKYAAGSTDEEEPMALGLTMDEIQQVIAEAAETTPDIGPEGEEMSDPEYVTAYLLNIIIPLLRLNNQRMEEQLRAVGIAVPTMEQIQAAMEAAQAAQDAPADGTFSESSEAAAASEEPRQ
jgi:hypothetical protein